jgi:hypothetical protein
MTEIVYILTNPVIPDLVKVGRTNNLEERVRSLSAHSGVPVPFEVYYACVVRDSVKVEKHIHEGFGDHRVNPKREFFRINPERVLAILKLVEEQDITPSRDFVEDADEQQSLNKERTRRLNFTFSSIGIPVGSTLHFVRDANITVKVVDDRNVEFEGSATPLSQCTLALLKRDYDWKSQRAIGIDFWAYENDSLSERPNRLEDEGQ